MEVFYHMTVFFVDKGFFEIISLVKISKYQLQLVKK